MSKNMRWRGLASKSHVITTYVEKTCATCKDGTPYVLKGDYAPLRPVMFCTIGWVLFATRGRWKFGFYSCRGPFGSGIELGADSEISAESRISRPSAGCAGPSRRAAILERLECSFIEAHRPSANWCWSVTV